MVSATLTARKINLRDRVAAAVATVALLLTGAGCSMVSRGQNAEGVRMYQQGYYQGAIDRFQQAINSNPTGADGYYNLAATYHRLGKLNNRRADLDQAESLYNQCLDRDGNHQDCYRALAVLLVEEQRRDEAKRLLQGWASRSPTLAAPKIELARMYEESGDKQSAKATLVEALSIDPYNSRALAALGHIHEELGDKPQALAVYERSLGHNRFQPDVTARVAALRGTTGTTLTASTTPGTTAPVTATRPAPLVPVQKRY